MSRVTEATTLSIVPMASLTKQRVIGGTTFGVLLFAWWEDRHIDVALKAIGVQFMSAAAIEKERRLSELLPQRRHRNILSVYGVVTDAPDGRCRLVMEYCSGGSLDAHLRMRKSDDSEV